MYVPPSIEAAKTLAKACGVQQIVIWTFCEGKGQHVTTWGEPLRHSALAAEAGNHVKKAAGWPLDLRQDLPASLGGLWEDVDARVAAAIGEGTMDKAHALAVLHLVREAVRSRDPKLAEQLIAKQCENAKGAGE